MIGPNHRQLAPKLQNQFRGYGHDAIAALTLGKLGRLSFSWVFLQPPIRETHETPLCLTRPPASDSSHLLISAASPLPQLTPLGTAPRESIRHILLGSPEAVRQTIHLLHTLHYVETVLWSPVIAIAEPLVISPAQGEAISLLRKPL